MRVTALDERHLSDRVRLLTVLDDVTEPMVTVQRIVDGTTPSEEAVRAFSVDLSNAAEELLGGRACEAGSPRLVARLSRMMSIPLTTSHPVFNAIADHAVAACVIERFPPQCVMMVHLFVHGVDLNDARNVVWLDTQLRSKFRLRCLEPGAIDRTDVWKPA